MPTAAELADDFEASNAEAIAFAESCTSDEWQTNVPGENWPVCVVVHHIALGHSLISGWVNLLRKGEAVVGTAQEVDDANAQHAAACSGVSVEETVALLRERGASAAASLRSLSDEELTREGPFGPANGQPFPVEHVAAVAAIHVRRHLGRAKEAVGRVDA